MVMNSHSSNPFPSQHSTFRFPPFFPSSLLAILLFIPFSPEHYYFFITFIYTQYSYGAPFTPFLPSSVHTRSLLGSIRQKKNSSFVPFKSSLCLPRDLCTRCQQWGAYPSQPSTFRFPSFFPSSIHTRIHQTRKEFFVPFQSSLCHSRVL